MRLETLAEGEFEFPEGAGDIEVSALTADSRQVTPGTIFFAISGAQADGAGFAGDAVDAGGVAVVASQTAKIDDVPVPVIRVDDPRLTLARSAARFHPAQPETLVAVTGTAGKTSVATFVRQIWEQDGRKAASIGTTGVFADGKESYGNLTTPDPVQLHQVLNQLSGDGITHASMEASSHGLDQFRLHGVKLAAAAFTNLGRDHLDYHSTMADYLEAKLILFRELMQEGQPAVVYADDPIAEYVIEAATERGLSVHTVGRKGEYIVLKKVEHQRFRQIVELEHGGNHFRIEFPLAGDFQIANGLVSAGLAITTGTKPEVAFKALESLQGASGRMELIGKNDAGAPVYVDYAHKPEAMENVLQSLRPFTSERLMVVFGCGGDRDPGKRPIMGEIAARLADVVIVTDDNPRTEDPALIRSSIMAAAEGATEVADRAEAIHYACGLLKKGDCLVVAGKGHEEGQIIGDKTLPFSDHQVVREALGLDG